MRFALPKITWIGFKAALGAKWGLLYLSPVLCCPLGWFSFPQTPWDSFQKGIMRKTRDIPTFPFGRANPLPWSSSFEVFSFLKVELWGIFGCRFLAVSECLDKMNLPKCHFLFSSMQGGFAAPEMM